MSKKLYENKNLTLCKFYKRDRNCTNNDQEPCGEQLKDNGKLVCMSNLYYAMDLEQQIIRLKWYLNEIRNEELKSLDVSWDEYEIGCETTDYSNIINLIEEALGEINYKDCRYKEEIK